jgi:hypothetical protein
MSWLFIAESFLQDVSSVMQIYHSICKKM